MVSTPETPRRIKGLLSRLVSPLLFVADDVVENFKVEVPAQTTLAITDGLLAVDKGRAGSSWTRSLPGLGYLHKSRDDSSAESGASTDTHASSRFSQANRRQVQVLR